jgi:hypothetical protein
MDPVTLTFYGIVCGLLAAFVPSAGRPFRFALGVGVGLIAAAFLPPLRALFGL